MSWSPPAGLRLTAPDGARLAYDDPAPNAPGVPILALAGLTRSAADFDFVWPHLAHRRVIAMDYRGRGRSAFTGADSYTIPREAGDALALLDHLGLERAAILGTSRGGLVAMALAAAAPDRLAGVCLNDIGPVIDPSGLEAIMGHLGRRPAARTLAEQARARASYAAGAGFEGVPPERWRAEVERHYIQEEDGLALRYDPALREAVQAAGAQPVPDLWPLFEALPAPLAAIRGAGSDLLRPETLTEMRRRRPDMRSAEVPGRGHVPFLDEPEALALLAEWTARL